MVRFACIRGDSDFAYRGHLAGVQSSLLVGIARPRHRGCLAVTHDAGSLRVVVTGLMAQHPSLGGMTWHYLQYVVGLRMLGHDVYYFEDSGEVPYTLDGGPSRRDWVAPDCSANVGYLNAILGRYGLADRWAYRYPPDDAWFGMKGAHRKEVLRSADLLINVSGSLEHPHRYRDVRRLVYIDTDPVVTQIKCLAETPTFSARVDAHDVHFSFGEKFSDEVPKTGHEWLPTRQPVVISEWRPAEHTRDVYSTVMSWTSYAPLRHAGRVYGQKDIEFQRFVELPAHVAPTRLEVAMARTQHRNWQAQLDNLPSRVANFVREHKVWNPKLLLEHTGWSVVDANERCGDLDSYRNYIQSSRGEWAVAKHAYVQGRPGWFSERSACYLASARPVVVQDTGFRAVLPVGEGLLSFTTVTEAAEAIREVESDYARHSRAAREIAEAYFDSGKVLTSLVEQAAG